MFEVDPNAAMSLMKLAPMGKKGGMQQMGMSILQAALNQKGQERKALGAMPQVGQTMPGMAGGPAGPMNLTPPTGGGMLGGGGLLSKLLGGGGLGFGGGAAGGVTGGLGGLY